MAQSPSAAQASQNAMNQLVLLHRRLLGRLADGGTTEDVAESLLKDVLATVGWKHGSVSWVDTEGGMYRTLAQVGDRVSTVVPQRLDDGVFGKVLDTQQPVQVELDKAELSKHTEGAPSGTGVALPIFIGNEVAGVLALLAGHTEPLEEARLIELEAIASVFGALVHRARSPFGDGRSASQVLHSQKLESIGALAGGVAHDFNNLLGVILGYVELAAMRITRAGPSPLRHLETALATLSRARSLADLLLGFSREGPGSDEPCEPNEVVQQARDLLAETLDRRIRFDVRLEQDVPASPLGMTDLRHVLINLCLNAADAMPEGGELGVQTLVRQVAAGEEEALPAGKYVGLCVRDSGTGIPAHMRDAIFRPGYTTRRDGGTGLGLWVVRTLAERFGGCVDLRSSRVGTTFTVWLPNELRVPRTPTLEGEPPVHEGPIDVLIVDDERGVREVTREFLEMDGYTVRAATTGAEAVEIMRAEPAGFRVVLLDNHLGDMRGIDLLGVIDALPYSPKVVIVTGMPGARELEDLPEHVSMLVKPYLQRHLAAMFDELGMRPNRS